MAEILKGAPVAEAMCEGIRAEVEKLRAEGITPTLAIVRVGARQEDLAYERGAAKRAEKVGVAVRREVFPEDIRQEDFFSELERISGDDSVHGILMFQPLPRQIDSTAARALIAPGKDVDGCTMSSMAGVFTNTPVGFPPCTAQAAMEILHYYGVNPGGKRAAVIGRSLVIGRPVAMMLMHENATVTSCHTRTPDIPAVTREAQILIAAAGVLRSVTAEFTSPDQIIIDVGINWDEEKQGIAGDVDFDSVEPVVQALTPVPGGVGSVTSTVLMKHVVEAAGRGRK